MRDLETLTRATRRVDLEMRMAGRRGDSEAGCFVMPSPLDGLDLRIIAAVGLGWDHVSVSRAERCPTWEEMDAVKREFFHDHETAMQLHVQPSHHINVHPYCLHLWRPLFGAIPLPPSIMVA